MVQIIEGLSGEACITDDIVVHGEDEKDHAYDGNSMNRMIRAAEGFSTARRVLSKRISPSLAIDTHQRESSLIQKK